MRWIVESVVIFLTFAVFMLGVAWWQGREPRIPLERLADPAPLPGELPIAGYFDLPDTLARFTAPDSRLSRVEMIEARMVARGELSARLPYGPFPVDTGPLLILSDKMAANVALEREIEQRCAEAEAKIPPRWR